MKMGESGKGKKGLKILKVLGWTLLILVVLVSALLFGAVKYLGSKNLAPLVEDVANDYIEGKVKMGEVRIGFKPKFPILGIEIDRLTVVSHAFDSLTTEERGLLPNYADSLLALDHLSGTLNLKRLIVNNELSIHDVTLRGLNVNLVIAHNGKANYEMIKEKPEDEMGKKSKIPGFRISRFALEQPREIRFFNASDSTSASVVLLTNAAVEEDKLPTYRLKLNGNVTSPKATLITNLDNIDFGLNGTVFWDPADPGLVAMDNMKIQGAFINASVTGKIDLKESPIVQAAEVDLEPVAVADLLTLLSDSIRKTHHLYEPYFATDATVSGRFELKAPMNLTTDTLPTAVIKLSIPPSELHYGKARFEKLDLDVVVKTVTNRPDSTVIDVRRLLVEGKATELSLAAVITNPVADPTFIADVKGDIDLSNLPPVVKSKIHGYLSGIISADLHADGSVSMLRKERIHRLIADGSVTARDLYFLSADTTKLVEINKAKIDLDSKRIIDDIPLLSAKLDVDTATVLVGGVDIAVKSLKLDAGVEDNLQALDSLHEVPLGGDLNVKRLNIISITDSAGARIRRIEGHVTMKGLKEGAFEPVIVAKLQPGSVSAGSLSDRIIINDAKIHASMSKLPSQGKHAKSVSRKADGLKEYPYLPPEKVFKYVYAKRHHKPGEKRTRRVYGELGANDNEMLKWNLAKGFRKFLTEWELRGTVTTDNARLLTPVFPLRNRFSHIALKFNNDTVTISNISLLAGKSDITLSGHVTNVQRALTSATGNTLKANLALLSDTIDINELSTGIFTGSAYATHRHDEKGKTIASADDKTLETRLNVFAKEGAGKAAPILIPVNIDANLRVDAKNMLYSDLLMKNMGADLLVYDGGVNIHGMKAYSDAGNLLVSALYSAPNPEKMDVGFSMVLDDFNIAKFVKLVPALDSIVPLMRDFAGTVDAEMAATCRLDSGMNLNLPTLDAAVRITGDNLAFIDPKKYRTLGKWLGFKNKEDNTIKRMNVEMQVDDGVMHVYPFSFDVDRYRLGIYGTNDLAMNFDYHIAVLKSPIPFKFGITISGNPKKHKVRFGGAKFKESTAIESVNIVNEARINLMDQIENVFKRGVRNSRFVKVNVARPKDFGTLPDPGLSAADSLQLIQEGLIEAPTQLSVPDTDDKHKEKHKHKKEKNDKKNDKHKDKH